MAGNGPAPKMQRQRERDTKRRDSEFTDIVPDKRKRGPALPKDHGFDDNVVAIYEDMRKWPQAQTWTGSEWLLIRTLLLPLYDTFLNGRGKNGNTAGEIRQLLASLGTTLPDRQRARIRIADEKDRETQEVPVTAGVYDLMELMSRNK
jgi:hypothetical protein